MEILSTGELAQAITSNTLAVSECLDPIETVRPVSCKHDREVETLEEKGKLQISTVRERS